MSQQRSVNASVTRIRTPRTVKPRHLCGRYRSTPTEACRQSALAPFETAKFARSACALSELHIENLGC
jgi:hypothetical protein